MVVVLTCILNWSRGFYEWSIFSKSFVLFSLNPCYLLFYMLLENWGHINCQSWWTMDTCGKTNAKFCNEVNEILAWNQSSLDQVNATLQMLPTELNPTHDHLPQHLKLSFPKFNGNHPIGLVYKVEQYFQNVAPDQKVPLASFHLEGIRLMLPVVDEIFRITYMVWVHQSCPLFWSNRLWRPVGSFNYA